MQISKQIIKPTCADTEIYVQIYTGGLCAGLGRPLDSAMRSGMVCERKLADDNAGTWRPPGHVTKGNAY